MNCWMGERALRIRREKKVAENKLEASRATWNLEEFGKAGAQALKCNGFDVNGQRMWAGRQNQFLRRSGRWRNGGECG